LLPPSSLAADLNHSAVNLIAVTSNTNVLPRSPEWQQIYITVQGITIAVINITNVFRPPSKPAADLYHSAVHYNYGNKHHKRIPDDVRTSSSSTSQHSALKMQ